VVEHERLRRRAGQTRGVIHRRPARGSLRAGTDENLAGEADAAKLVSDFGDHALLRIYAAPARDGVMRDERLPFGAPADHLPPAENYGRSSGVHFPVTAALMQSRVEPNHAWMFMIDGR